MSRLALATSGDTRRRGYADASGSANEPAVNSYPRYVDQRAAAYHQSLTPSVPDIDVLGSPVSSCGGYGSASDWLKKKNFGTSGRQRSEPHLSLPRRNSMSASYPNTKVQKEHPPPETMDAWFEQYFGNIRQQTAPKQLRDNTLRYLEYHSCPGMFRIYFRGQPGISIQVLLSKWRFDNSDIQLRQLINFRLVNPPVHFKLPDGTFAQRAVGGVKISDSMTIYEFCIKIAGKMKTPLGRWDVKDLTMVSLELAQDSVVCFLGTICSPAI